MQRITGNELAARLRLSPHVEGGAYRKLYRDEYRGGRRPASGVIYYALGPGETADFHCLDCDEYWLHHAGCDVEIWLLNARNEPQVHRLGCGVDAQPCVWIPAGTVFGARLVPGSQDAAVVSCVTVPDFSYDAYRLYTPEEAVARWPALSPFYT